MQTIVRDQHAAPGEYVLGYEYRELDRLARQAAFYEELTEEALVRAGIGEGMRVLDLGCGVGDVSLLAARLVGPRGAVVGIDRAAHAIRTAERRAATSNLPWARFETAELDTFETTETFDALIGRFVLVYLRDPAPVLRRLLRFVQPGGVVAFQEMDIRTMRCFPELPLVNDMQRWITAVYERAGFEPDMGTHQARAFVAAGLPMPSMAAAARVESGPDAGCYEYFAETLRSALPAIEAFGIASAAEIGIDTLAERFRDQAVSADAIFHLPLLVTAWTTRSIRCDRTSICPNGLTSDLS